MQYLAWRVLSGLNNSITLSFLIMGHTKFSPDWYFGLFKQAYRWIRIGCLDNIVWVVESSAAVNHAQLIGTHDGKVIVPTYDWASFFDEPFRQRALKGIKSIHHLMSKPGYVIVKDSVDSPWERIADGTGWKSCKYLFNKIREFCPECPAPTLHLKQTHHPHLNATGRTDYLC